MAKSIWRRNDLIYMPRKKKEKKNGDEPTPPSGQGDVFALMATGNIYGDMSCDYFVGYQSLASSIGTVNNRFTYKHSGLSDIDVIMWKDLYGASGIESLIWSRRSGSTAKLLFIPDTGTDLYLVTYYGAETFTVQTNNVTAVYTYQGTTYDYYCRKFTVNTANNFDSVLQSCPGYGGGNGHVLLVLGPSLVQDLTDASLLSIANTVLAYYQTGQTVNAVIRV